MSNSLVSTLSGNLKNPIKILSRENKKIDNSQKMIINKNIFKHN
jgi:hypothetical protein